MKRSLKYREQQVQHSYIRTICQVYGKKHCCIWELRERKTLMKEMDFNYKKNLDVHWKLSGKLLNGTIAGGR